MRLAKGNIYLDSRGRRHKRMSLELRVQLHKNYMARMPKWRHASVGYIIATIVISLSTICALYLRIFLGYVLFPSSIFVLSVLFVALFWGVGPALWSIALGALALNYFFVLPIGVFTIDSWQDIAQLIPFMIAGLIVAVITAQRERARLQALAAEHELQLYAEELEETNRRLEDANQMKDRFLSIASHELKTPITTIRGQAQLMLRRLSKQNHTVDLEGVETALERINSQTSRLTMLIDELLEVSSMRAGKATLNKRVCDLRTLCREVVDDQQFLTGRQIHMDVPVEPMNISLDGDRISQVLTNIIGNAIKYSPEHTPIEVCVNCEGEKALIKVRDHGRGVAKDQQERIFDTFYRTPDAQSSSKRGLGLGLAITKDIVERHHGRIWCESKLHEGSTFFVELPLETIDDNA